MKTRNIMSLVIVLLLATIFLNGFFSGLVQAETVENTTPVAEADVKTTPDESAAQVKSSKAFAAGIAIAFAGGLGALGMAYAIAKSSESISRQPEAESGIRSSLILGLVFIETLVIYALIVAILIIFVL